MIKYPSTRYHEKGNSLANFIDRRIVITEKIDGANVALYDGNVYSRGGDNPERAGWLAMVKKHHAHKTINHRDVIFGEDIFGVHSIQYGPVYENQTFRVFSIFNPESEWFAPFSDVLELELLADILPVPVLWIGTENNERRLEKRLKSYMSRKSALGGEMEGVVFRVADAFSLKDFPYAVRKIVRPNHVQSEIHWSRNWERCALL